MKRFLILIMLLIAPIIFAEEKSEQLIQLEEIIIGHQIKVFDSETFDASDPRHYPSIFQYVFLYNGTFFAFDEYSMRMRLGEWKTYDMEGDILGIELTTHETSTTMNVMLGSISEMTSESFIIMVKGGLKIEFHRSFYDDENGLVWMY